jgi:hypothetical protein
MSSNNAASNVIPMREFERPPSTQQQAVQFERLLQECQDVAAERLGKSVTGMLDKADEALWNLANSGTERELRDRYLKAKDKVRSERHLLEEQFRDNYLAEFERRMHRDGKSPQQFSQYDFTSTELGLVADDDLEETLKLNDMAAKVRRYCEEELAALDQRVGVLVGDATLQGEGNPFSPQAICSAFKQACRHVEPDLKVRMVFHALFDDHVLDDIRSIYKDLNALLVQRSILPKIRYGTRRGADGATPQSGSAAGELSEGARAAGARGEGGSEQDFFAVLQNLLGVNARTMLGMPGGAGIQVQQPAGGPQAGATQIPGFPPIAAGGVAPGAPVVMLQGAELLGSLTRIQHGDVSMIAGGNLPLSSALVQPGTTNVLRELKETNLGGGLGQMDAMTLDIVSMLFDEIFDDARVAVAMKGLIGRLQIPMLKVALLDKSFFSNKVHAARRLLDSLGEIGLGLPDDFDHTSAVYKQIETVLQKLIDGFREEMQVFDDAREELERLITEQNQHADEEAARVARGIEQQEKLELAKTVAQDEIRRRAEERKIPRVVLKFLAEQWVKLLLVAHAKHGTDSELWKTALATMDMLIWSVTPMPLLEERRVLGTKLPGLLKRLSAGMQMIRVDDDTRKKFFSKLMRCHTNIINGVGPTDSSAAKPAAAAPAASPPPPASAKPPAAPDHTQAPSSAQTAQAASKQKTQAAPLAQAAASAQAAPSAQGAPSADKVQAASPPQTAQAGSKQTTQPAPPAQAAPSAQAASSAQAVPPRQTTLGAPSGPPAQAGPSAQSPATPSVPSVHAPAAVSAQAAPAQSTSKPPAQPAARHSQ